MEEDIAVIGLGLRFPGEAQSPEQLWGVLERGESQWSEFPKDRLNIDGYFHPGGDRQGSISFRGAHFLKEDIAVFDSPFFSIAAEDAKAIDPQQRMLLEVTYEAIESAGLRKEDIDGSDTAVYVGSFVKDYEQICLRDPDWQPQYAATGNGIAIMANRISHFFNFHGPSMTIDTGCSGSLVSVHLAAQSLRSGESSLAIAAGSGMILTPNTIMPMTALNFLSPDGKCFTFDSRANGYGRGEGIGVVVLKKISDAIRDNDTIRAVIRGSSVNQDGRTPGITLPSKEAQVSNIRAVYAAAGLSFDQTAYVECHGTGTQAGDWREVKAISETLGSCRPVDRPIVVGSIKPNIGHLEGAAGVAGIIKGILVLEHAKIPANINFEKPNPTIDFESWRVKVPRSLMAWPVSGLRRVSVNCFGFGGTNAHVILDEAPAYLSARGMLGQHNSVDTDEKADDFAVSGTGDENVLPQLLCYSSHEKSGVSRIIKSHLDYFRASGETRRQTYMLDYAYTLGCRRSNLEWKGFVVASSISDFETQAKSWGDEGVVRTSKNKKPQIAFIFCGQGSQWAQMGKDLMGFETFSRAIHEASDYMTHNLFASFHLLTEIMKEEPESLIAQPQISQPATTAIQIALVDLVQSFGISPKQVIGHSSGEIAAAYACGALTKEAAWEVAYYRGLLAASIRSRAPKLRGAMIVVGMSQEEADAYLTRVGLSAQIACINSPRSITISGREDAIALIERDMRENKIFCRILNVNIAYHSSQMKLVEQDYRELLTSISGRPCLPTVDMISSVTGELIHGEDLGASYWAKNMVSPVQYLASMRALMQLSTDKRPTFILELSPRPSLRSPTMDILSSDPGVSLPTYCSILDPKVNGAISLLRMIGDLWTQGYPVNMMAVFNPKLAQTRPKSLPSLPLYPWNHSKSYWHESHLSLANRFRKYGRQDLIGAPTADSVPFEPRWRGFLRISENPWIQDHQVQKTIVYPAAGMVSMVLEAAIQMTQDMTAKVAGYEVFDMKIDKAMIIPNTNHGLEVALNIKTNGELSTDMSQVAPVEFAIYSKPHNHDWERNASGHVRFEIDAGGCDVLFERCDAQHERVAKLCAEQLSPRQLYELLDTIGMNYGPLFQNILEIRKGANSCVAKVQVPDTLSKMPAKFEYPHLIHPATLDSMFQTLFAIDSSPMVPTFIKRVFVSASVAERDETPFDGYAIAERKGIRDAEAFISMKRPGSPSARVVIEGLRLAGLSTPSPSQGGFLPNHRNLCTEIIWDQDATFAQPTHFDEQLRLLAHKFPALAVLQVGGTHNIFQRILAVLAPDQDETPRLARYTLVSNSEGDIPEQELASLKGSPLEQFCEIKRHLSEIAAKYHLVVVFEDSGVEVPSLERHLRHGGVILYQSKARSETSASEDLPRNGHVVGNSEKRVEARAVSIDGYPMPFGITHSRSASAAETEVLDVAILLPDTASAQATALKEVLEVVNDEIEAHLSISVIKSHELQDKSCQIAGKIVISLLDFCESMCDGCSVFEWSENDFQVFDAIRRAAKGVFWLTRSAHMKPSNPRGAPVIALARTLMSEDPLKTIVTFDLGLASRLDDRSVVRNVLRAFQQAFRLSPGSDVRETEYAEEHGRIYIPRLTTVRSLNRLIEDGHHGGPIKKRFAYDATKDLNSACLKLTIKQPGIVDESLLFSEFCPQELGPDAIEIEVDEAPLTSADVDTIMGQTAESNIGLDVMGYVRRLGRDVTGIQVRDRVMAMVPGGAIQNLVHANAKLVARYQHNMVPSFCVTAYHAIINIGRARRGRKVLVQAGSSAHGMMAIRMAQSTGAEVFASVFGPDAPAQRDFLLKSGVDERHIVNADSAGFVHLIRAVSGGEGMDILFNPTQHHINTGFECVKQCGTIIQFSSKSSSPWAVPSIGGSVTIVNYDLGQLIRHDMDFVAEMLGCASRHMTTHCQYFDHLSEMKISLGIDELGEALRHLQRTPYTGYVSLVAGEREVSVVDKNSTKPLSQALDSHGTYLLAGGLGGLGQSISELLVSNGVRHLAYLSRSGGTSDQAKSFLADLQSRGIDARAFSVDICDKTALTAVIASAVTAEMPPIKGVFQCAAVIKDAVFDNMTFGDWEAAIKPKTVGSLNLVDATIEAGHDPFFIFLASSAGVIGNRGQANYAAGNCFQDALAHSCRLQGRHAVAVDLGPVLGAGMLAQDDEILNMLRASGFYGIRHCDFLKVMSHAITGETTPGTPMPAQVILGVGTGGIIRQNQPADPYWSRTALYSYLNLVDMPPPDLSAAGSATAMDTKTMLACCADAAAAADIIRAGLMAMLAKAMTMLPEELDAHKPPNAYGVDSLIAVGVRNFVLSSFGVQVSVFEVLSDATIAELSVTIAEKGGYGTDRV
ncbi:hypothetical protein HIM_04750 [Hirsutella minnesotensis 3608]|uniref:Uncharacterized protein n=1 Tax=Hirsutella minnesotensis 3608 TaxID=1043627 RepID=A0A0F7ZL29_9HYPO|nr:hypothetical protein HIM_04750 [Hirsutella minnesotensis 3608]